MTYNLVQIPNAFVNVTKPALTSIHVGTIKQDKLIQYDCIIELPL